MKLYFSQLLSAAALSAVTVVSAFSTEIPQGYDPIDLSIGIGLESYRINGAYEKYAVCLIEDNNKTYSYT